MSRKTDDEGFKTSLESNSNSQNLQTGPDRNGSENHGSGSNSKKATQKKYYSTSVKSAGRTQPLPPACAALREMQIEGNIIPRSWWQTKILRLADGKTNLPAIVLLSDVVYFYRPYEEVDEQSGLTLGWKKRFSMDKMWKDYEEWGSGFGLTKRQVQDAVAFLKHAGLITVEFRTLWINGERKPNRPFIEPVIDKLRSITYSAAEAWELAKSSVTIIETEDEEEAAKTLPETPLRPIQKIQKKVTEISEPPPAVTQKTLPPVKTEDSNFADKNVSHVKTGDIPHDITGDISHVKTEDTPHDITGDIHLVKTGDYITENILPRVASENSAKITNRENQNSLSLNTQNENPETEKIAPREGEKISQENKYWLKDYLRGSQLGSSKFNFSTCTMFAEHQKRNGAAIREPVAVAAKYLKEAIMDEQIEAWLDEQFAPQEILKEKEMLQAAELETRKFIQEHRSFCPACFGSGMEVIPGKGARKCECPQLTVEYIKIRLEEEKSIEGSASNLNNPIAELTENTESYELNPRILPFRSGQKIQTAEIVSEGVSSGSTFADQADSIYRIALEGNRCSMETIESDWKNLFDELTWRQIKDQLVNLMEKNND